MKDKIIKDLENLNPLELSVKDSEINGTLQGDKTQELESIQGKYNQMSRTGHYWCFSKDKTTNRTIFNVILK